jgi:hypothetical protein
MEDSQGQMRSARTVVNNERVETDYTDESVPFA